MVEEKTMREVGIVLGLVGSQCVYAVNSMLLSYLMALGLHPLTLVVLFTLAASLLLTPLALLLERKLWPTSLSFKLATKLVLLAVFGVTLFQSLYLEGMKHTSASMATAMPNLCPAFIFIMAWSVGMEQVKLSCVYSRVKIGGTVLCVLGAFVMSFMHSTTTTPPSSPTESSTSVHALHALPYNDIVWDSVSPVHALLVIHYNDVVLDKEKVLGCLILLASVLILSANLVLQASVLTEFPAPMSVFSIVSFIGTITTTTVQFVRNGNLGIGGVGTIEVGQLIGYIMLGGIAGGGSMSFNGWVMKKKGPVLVSMFSPIATVVCVLVSSLTLGEPFSLGSMVGMSLMLGGLYLVLWAKGKESYEGKIMEKPLFLS